MKLSACDSGLAFYLFQLVFLRLHQYSLSRKFSNHQKKITFGQRQFCYRGEAGVGEKVMGCCQVCSSCTQQFCDANVIPCPCQTAFLPAQTDAGALLLGSVQSCILIPNGCPTCHHFSSSYSL